jgi:hypothetical protein
MQTHAETENEDSCVMFDENLGRSKHYPSLTGNDFDEEIC